MGKQNVAKTVLIIFSICLVFFALVLFSRSDEKEAKIAENQALVGESIVLNDDTIKIHRYHVLHDEFILEDGRRASRDLVVTLLVR